MANDPLNYPKISGRGRPCGLWPEDRTLDQEQELFRRTSSITNFGCANQRNLAGPMVDNPSDLVQAAA